MIQETTVLEIFAQLSGESVTGDEPRPALCRALCSQAAEEIAARTPDLPEEAASRAARWAAALAYYRLTLADEAAGPGDISADGVTVKAGERSQKALALVREYRRALAAYLGEEGFSFVLA